MAEGTQQHPLKIYFSVWILLFVLSAFSYMVDWYQFEGFMLWGLICVTYDPILINCR
jgi:cytochrome c oxidase subunit IV